jgi:hypothetical protein
MNHLDDTKNDEGGDKRAAVVKALRAALSGAESWYDIHGRIRKSVPDGEEDRYRSLVWAFGYDLTSPEEVDRRDREGSAFGAMMEFAEGRMPPRLAEVPIEDVTLWVDAFDAVDDPRSRSRLGDLLWERRVEPRPDQRARAAAIALVALCDDPHWEPMETTQGLVRALELARSVSDPELIDLAAAQMVTVAKDEMTLDEHRPGIPFTLLESLVALPPKHPPKEVEELIVLVEEKYREDPFQVNTAIDLRCQLAGPVEVGELRRRQVVLWRDRARGGDGLLKLSFLRTALELATAHGFRDEAEALRVELAEISEDELDLKEISAEVKMPREETEKFFKFFVERDDWRISLGLFANHGPPGGEPESLNEAVAEKMKNHPFQYLVTGVVLDPDLGIPVFESTDDDSHVRAARAQHRVFAARLWGVFAVRILREIEERFGRPDRHELVDFFTTDLISATNAERIAEALELWWEGETNLSACLLAPRIEAVVRDMANRLGLATVWEPTSNKPGRARSLGVILSSMRGRIGTPGWHAYLISLLTDSLGLNLRNVISHGLRPEIGPDDAALLIHAACFLAILGRSDPQQPE